MLMTLALATTSAHACGGFFCGNTPVDQKGEDIVFSVDAEAGETTVHVQIEYSGEASEFAWVVPVPQVPELLLSSDTLFRELLWRTAPRFQVEYEELWECEDDRIYPPMAGASSASFDDADTTSGGVRVVETGRVGPYETAILAATTSAALLEWLQTNGYQLPDALEPVLAPYVASESFFVALKLAKDRDVGALQPLAMKYAGTAVSVPIQLTSIAATPDLRLHVYLLGDARAVPQSYYHVQVNDLVLDWFGGVPNYDAAITVAADEAGGHAFATDYSGTSDVMDQALFVEGRYDVPALAAAPDAYAFFDLLLRQGFVGDEQMLAMFREFLPKPASLAGVDETDFYNCLSCWSAEVDAIPFDAAAFAAAIDERIVQPLKAAQTLFDASPRLTRLTSSVSPDEMTVDPTFVFNADMAQDVSIDRSATVQVLCGFGGKWSESPRRLVLADGRTYDLPSERWFAEQGTTEYEYLSDLMTVYALVIEQTGAEGEPVVIADFTDQAFDDAEAFSAQGGGPGGCGCGTGLPSGGGLAAGLALTLLARRRRS